MISVFIGGFCVIGSAIIARRGTKMKTITIVALLTIVVTMPRLGSASDEREGVARYWHEFWGDVESSETDPLSGRFILHIGRSLDFSNAKSQVVYLIDSATGQVWMQVIESKKDEGMFGPLSPGYWQSLRLPIDLLLDRVSK